MNKIRNFFLSCFLFVSSLLSCCGHPSPNSLEIVPNRFYIGTIGTRQCLLFFDDITSTTITGQYFMLDEGPLTHGVDFSAKVLKRRYKVKIGNEDFNVKLSWNATDDVLSGSYISEKGRGDFSFVEYQVPEYKEFKKRYQEECFNVKIVKDVEYGKAQGFWTSYPTTDEANYLKVLSDGIGSSFKKKELSLRMDVYLPQEDTLTKRPLLIMIHGGAFYIGDKASQAFQKWCTHFASLGYVTVSLNYRLGFRLSKQSIERTGYNAVQDAHAATRYLVSHRNDYGIDTSLIFVGGSSAGGITSLNLAFMRNNTRPKSSYGKLFTDDLGNLESSGNKIKANFRIKAVANMWGAVNDLKQIENSRTSIISFHGDADQIVPYDNGYPFSDIKGPVGEMFFERMYGSASIHRKAKQLGLREEMYTLKGMGHGPYEDKNGKLTPVFNFIQDHMDAFFYPEIVNDNATLQPCTPQAYVTDRWNEKNELAVIEVNMPQCYELVGDNISQVYWKIEGGFILSQQTNNVKVVWLENYPVHRLTASGCYTNGAAFVRTVEK